MALKKVLAKKRNVVLRIDTYNKLESYKVYLVSERNNPNVTFDDAVNNLLDNHRENRKKQNVVEARAKGENPP